MLSSVLLHDNADIGNAAVEVCGELLDDDTLREMDRDTLQPAVQQLVSRLARFNSTILHRTVSDTILSLRLAHIDNTDPASACLRTLCYVPYCVFVPGLEWLSVCAAVSRVCVE